jgi:hypothetical protein
VHAAKSLHVKQEEGLVCPCHGDGYAALALMINDDCKGGNMACLTGDESVKIPDKAGLVLVHGLDNVHAATPATGGAKHMLLALTCDGRMKQRMFDGISLN